MASAPKKRRLEISIEQKKEICTFRQQNPKMSQAEIAKWATNHLGRPVAKSSVGDIVRKSDQWLKTPDITSSSPLRHKHGQHPDLESALQLWLNDVRARNAVVNDEMMLEKAKWFGKQLNIDNLNYSRGWLARFKERKEISRQKIQGEAASADMTKVCEGRTHLQEVLSHYDPEDIYNMDETALFYQLGPSSTLSTAKKVPGTKSSKARITVALCSNATGIDKVKPLVIGHARRPRCFGKNFDPELYAKYAFNTKAWMTRLIFDEWVCAFDKRMKREGRHVLLLLDNATSHSKDLSLTNITLQFLPPNTTSHIQPMDARIINSFKCHYRKHLVRHYLQCVEEERAQSVDLRQALGFVKHAWSEVTSTTIYRCWKHTKILPGVTPVLSEENREVDEDDIPLATLRTLMLSLSPESLDPRTYVSVETTEPTSGELTDDTIVEIIQGSSLASDNPNTPDPESDVPSVETQPEVMTSKEARAALQGLVHYFEECGDPEASTVITSLQYAGTILNKNWLKSMRQASLKDYFRRYPKSQEDK